MSDYLLDYNFELPDTLIAKSQVDPRDSSRLLQFRDGFISEHYFRDIVDLVPDKTVFILNDSRVAKARLNFVLGGKSVEVFFVDRVSGYENRFLVLCSPGKLFKNGVSFCLPGNKCCRVVDVLADGSRIIESEQIPDVYEYLSKFGNTPLPPYIKVDNPNDFADNYQTVYAKNFGSVAAPTAGLHFTNELIEILENKGCKFVYVTLNVGLGTFLPVKSNLIAEHKMHTESFSITDDSAILLNNCKKNGYKFVAVGTTSLRVLQSSYNFELSKFVAGSSNTDIFIYPGFKDFVVDALITNFHLPKSTLFMLVSAIVGLEEAKRIYSYAISEKYRFYSFGDASLIWI